MPSDPLSELGAALPPNYTVTRFIKQGGQGAVLEGTLGTDRVAIKLFEPSVDVRRLEREVTFLCSLSCPSLVKVLDVTTVTLRGQTVPVVVFEYVDGKDLRDALLTPLVTVNGDTLARIGEDVGIAIEAIWQHRVVHRDIKPDNIMQRPNGHYVLVDLALAQHLGRSTITAPNAAPGTRGYRSPEQQRGRTRLTVHSDVFSLGVTLYELGAKAHPWNGQEHLMTFSAPPPLARVRPDLPGALCANIHRMLAVQPGLRPKAPSKLFGTGDE